MKTKFWQNKAREVKRFRTEYSAQEIETNIRYTVCPRCWCTTRHERLVRGALEILTCTVCGNAQERKL